MNVTGEADFFDDAMLAADEDHQPIEAWTLDELDQFADVRSWASEVGG